MGSVCVNHYRFRYTQKPDEETLEHYHETIDSLLSTYGIDYLISSAPYKAAFHEPYNGVFFRDDDYRLNEDDQTFLISWDIKDWIDNQYFQHAIQRSAALAHDVIARWATTVGLELLPPAPSDTLWQLLYHPDEQFVPASSGEETQEYGLKEQRQPHTLCHCPICTHGRKRVAPKLPARNWEISDVRDWLRRPSKANFASICVIAEQYYQRDRDTFARILHPYIQEHLEDWPDELREAPYFWVQRIRMNALGEPIPYPCWEYVRSLVIDQTTGWNENSAHGETELEAIFFHSVGLKDTQGQPMMKHIRYLSITTRQGFCGSFMRALKERPDNIVQLRRLELCPCYDNHGDLEHNTDDLAVFLSALQHTQITDLSLDEVGEIDEACFEAIAAIPNLRSLQLWWAYVLDWRHAKGLWQHPTFKELSMFVSTQEVEEDLPADGLIEAMQQFGSPLQSLSMRPYMEGFGDINEKPLVIPICKAADNQHLHTLSIVDDEEKIASDDYQELLDAIPTSVTSLHIDVALSGEPLELRDWRFPQLQTLSWPSYPLKPNDISALFAQPETFAKTETLELHFENAEALQQWAVTAPPLTTLRSLTFSLPKDNAISTDNCSAWWQWLQTCARLETLVTKYIPIATKDFIQLGRSPMGRHVQTIELKNAALTTQHILALGTKTAFDKVTSLYVYGNDELNEQSLPALLESPLWNELRHLNLRGNGSRSHPFYASPPALDWTSHPALLQLDELHLPFDKEVRQALASSQHIAPQLAYRLSFPIYSFENMTI